MLIFLAEIRPYLETGYFIAGMLLVLGLLVAFRQISLIKQDIRLRNERAAKEHAIQACSRYLFEFVDKTRIADREREEKKLGSYEGKIGDFSFDSVPRTELRASFKRMKILSNLPALNELEAISACFTTGVAHERTGFQIIGRSYCNSVESYYDVISLCRQETAHPYWYNIVKLYLTWRPRLSKAELESTLQSVEDKISSLGPDLGIKVIGEP